MSSVAVDVKPTAPKRGGARNISGGTIFAELSEQIKSAGLLEKTVGFYVRKTVLWGALTIIAWAAVILLAPSPLALVMAPVLGIIGAQFGFLAHEAGHRQVFNSVKVNRWYALIVANLMVGLSFGWWDKKKHNLHHANPNTVGKDPDINISVLAFTKEAFDSKKGVEGFLTRRQGWLFPLLLLFTMFDLLASSLKALILGSHGQKSGGKPLQNRWLELSLLLAHFVAPAVTLFIFFSPWVAVLFGVAQMMTAGLFMGGAFAPNHKGMPVIPAGSKVDFFSKQVLTSRDIRGGWFMDNLMGGLNYQVEHHLFPSMPRPHLRKANSMVKQFCLEKNVPFVETGFFESYGIVIRYLSKVGLKNSDPFECPLVKSYRYSAS